MNDTNPTQCATDPACSDASEPRHVCWTRCVERFVAPLFLLPGIALAAETQDPSRLTIDRIFASDEFDLEEHGPVHWLEHQQGYTTLEKTDRTEGGRDIVRYDPRTGHREVFVPSRLLIPSGESSPLAVDDYAWSSDGALLLVFTNSKRVWRRNTRGDYWVLDVASRELRQLGGDAAASTLMFAKFSPDGRKVAYVRENNIYVEEVHSGRITQVTKDGSEDIINGTFDWVYEEELGLQDGYRWSPNGKSIAYWQLDTRGVREFYLINNTDSLYPRLIPIRYPKVGETNSACRVGVVSVEAGDPKWLEVPGDPRNHYIARMDWAENSTELVIQQLNRLQNTNTVMLGDARTGRVATVLTERDSAWVDVHDGLRWLDDGQRFTWLSERDGWRHVYVVSRAGGEIQLVTPGPYDVMSIDAIDKDEGWVYYTASPDNPTQRYLYRARIDGSAQERVTPDGLEGTHGYEFSSDAQFAIHTVSSFDKPPVTNLVRLPAHETVKGLADNSELRTALDKLTRPSSEFFRVDVGDGVLLDGWSLRPPGLDETKKHPLLVFVYGETAAQTVLDRWGGKRHLWHMMLAQNGYLVMSFDNRGTPAPRGRQWRKVVYRQIGILSSREQAAALRAVTGARPYVDKDRVGIWGWSGGGSMSLNMIFRFPELYHLAMAVAPVPNQRYYDSIYQERYMGLPQDNVEGYREGSPITHAHRLEGKLLLVHGTGDDNVHYQGAEALVTELIATNKPFTMMSYPNRTHAIREGVNTSRHLYDLLARYLQENLPSGGEDR